MIDSNSIRNMITNAALEVWQDEIKAREDEERAHEERRREREEQYQEQAAIATRALVDAEFGVSNAPLLDDGRLQIDDHVYLRAEIKKPFNLDWRDVEIPNGNDLAEWTLRIALDDPRYFESCENRAYRGLEHLGEVINEVRAWWQEHAEQEARSAAYEERAAQVTEEERWAEFLKQFNPFGLASTTDLNKLEQAERENRISFYTTQGFPVYDHMSEDVVCVVKVRPRRDDEMLDREHDPADEEDDYIPF